MMKGTVNFSRILTPNITIDKISLSVSLGMPRILPVHCLNIFNHTFIKWIIDIPVPFLTILLYNMVKNFRAVNPQFHCLTSWAIVSQVNKCFMNKIWEVKKVWQNLVCNMFMYTRVEQCVHLHYFASECWQSISNV